MRRHSELNPYLGVHAYGLGDLLSEQARSRPRHVAVVDGTYRLNYKELDNRVNKLASVLIDRGIEWGDRILWLGQNSFRVLELIFAAARLGAILCPINWRDSLSEVEWTIDDFDPKFIFWQEAEIGEVSRRAKDLRQDGRHWIQHDGNGPEDYEALVATGVPLENYPPVEASTPVLAIYTAAFSGKPAAALLSNECLMLMGMDAKQGQLIDEDSSYLASGPMFHVGVMMGVFGTAIAGGKNAIVARIVPDELLELIQNEKLTHAYIPQPTIVQMKEAVKTKRYDVTSLFKEPDLSDWKSMTVMPADAPQLRKIGGYGQTEMGGLTVNLAQGGTGAGRPAPFLQIKIIDDDGNEVPDGAVGEILARGPVVMCGYWRRAQENERRVIQGWHRTNDLGKRLPDGSIAFVGPKTSMIKTGVENIYPTEIENCLRLHEGVADVCIIGVPDPVWDQNVKAVIVRRPGTNHPPESFIEHCRERLASYKKPKIVAFSDALPRDAHGAIDRAAVDAAFGGGNYPRVE